MRRKIVKKFRVPASKACRKLNIYDTTKRTWISFFNLRILAYSLRIYALRYHDNNLDASYPSSWLLQKETWLYRGVIEPALYYQLRISEKICTVRLSKLVLLAKSHPYSPAFAKGVQWHVRSSVSSQWCTYISNSVCNSAYPSFFTRLRFYPFLSKEHRRCWHRKFSVCALWRNCSTVTALG